MLPHEICWKYVVDACYKSLAEKSIEITGPYPPFSSDQAPLFLPISFRFQEADNSTSNLITIQALPFGERLILHAKCPDSPAVHRLTLKVSDFVSPTSQDNQAHEPLSQRPIAADFCNCVAPDLLLARVETHLLHCAIPRLRRSVSPYLFGVSPGLRNQICSFLDARSLTLAWGLVSVASHVTSVEPALWTRLLNVDFKNQGLCQNKPSHPLQVYCTLFTQRAVSKRKRAAYLKQAIFLEAVEREERASFLLNFPPFPARGRCLPPWRDDDLAFLTSNRHNTSPALRRFYDAM